MKKEQLMVRLCPRCGLVYSVNDEECEVCSADLSQPMPSREAEKQSKKISKRSEKLKESIAAEKASGGAGSDFDPEVPRTGLHIAEGVIGSVVALAIVVMLVLHLCGIYSFEGMAIELIGADLLALLLLALPIVHGFSPSTMWAMLHFEAQLDYNIKGTISPSGFSIFRMHFLSIFMIVLGIIMFGLHFLPLFLN